MENMEIDLKWGRRLEHLRKNRNLTQVGLADETGISLRTIEDYEQGKSKTPNVVTILLLASFFDIDSTTLLYGGNNIMASRYEDAVVKELEQIKKFETIKEIHDEELNGTILSKLSLSEDLITTVRNSWEAQNLFDIRKNDSTIEKHSSYRTYVRDTILKYCQNRENYIKKYKLKNCMKILNDNNGLA